MEFHDRLIPSSGMLARGDILALNAAKGGLSWWYVQTIEEQVFSRRGHAPDRDIPYNLAFNSTRSPS